MELSLTPRRDARESLSILYTLKKLSLTHRLFLNKLKHPPKATQHCRDPGMIHPRIPGTDMALARKYCIWATWNIIKTTFSSHA